MPRLIRRRRRSKRRHSRKSSPEIENKLFHDVDILPELLNFSNASFKLALKEYTQLLQQFTLQFGVKCLTQIIFCGIYNTNNDNKIKWINFLNSTLLQLSPNINQKEWIKHIKYENKTSLMCLHDDALLCIFLNI